MPQLQKAGKWLGGNTQPLEYNDINLVDKNTVRRRSKDFPRPPHGNVLWKQIKQRFSRLKDENPKINVRLVIAARNGMAWKDVDYKLNDDGAGNKLEKEMQKFMLRHKFIITQITTRLK